MGWVAAAVSGIAATVGVTTIVVGLQSDASGGGPADVWIDGPRAEASLVPGDILVSAHATAEARIEDLVLEVDGEQVADAEDVERNGKLVYATFTWAADEGEHVLVVTQEGGDGARSAERLVYVGNPLAPVPVKPTPTPSEKPSERPSPPETPSESVATSESATPTHEPKPVPKPTKKPKPTPQAEPPTLGAVTVTPNPVNAPDCAGNVVVRANVSGATSGSARIYRTNLSKDIGGSISGGVFTATFKQADLYGANTSGDFSVSVTVTNKAGSITKDGAFSVYCSKD